MWAPKALPQLIRSSGHLDGGGGFDGQAERVGFVMREQIAVGVQELGAPSAIDGEDVVEFGTGAETDDELVEFLGWAKASRVLDGDFAKHTAALSFAEDFHHQIEMTFHHSEVFFKAGFGR